MKKNLLLSIFAALSVVAAVTYSPVGADTYNHTECPRVDPLYYTVMLPNPEDCGTYFVCSKGVPILERCPIGLHWNDKLKCCDWPQDAGCEKNGKGTPATYTKVVETEVKTTSSSGWSWDIKLNVWLFEGKASNNSPADVTTTKTTETLSYPCCEGEGLSTCTYGACPQLGEQK